MTESTGFRIIESKPQQYIDIVKALLLAMAVLGATWILGITFIEQPVWPWLYAAAAAAIVLPSIPAKSVQNAITIALLAVVIAIVVIGRNLFRSGFLQTVNYAILRFNYVYGQEIYYYDLPTGVDKRVAVHIFAALVIFLLGSMFQSFLANKRTLAFGLLNAVMIAMVLFLQVPEASLACITSCIAIPGSVIWARGGSYARRPLTIGLSVLLILSIGISAGYMQWSGYQKSVTADTMRQGATERIDALRYGKDDAPKGSLPKASSFEGDKETRLVLGVSRPGRYFLKGFVGSSYDAALDHWMELDPNDYHKDHEGLFTWLKAKHFQPLAQNSVYLRLLMKQQGESVNRIKTSVTVLNENANRKFLYVPYGMSEDTVRGLDGIHRDLNVYQKERKQKAVTYDVDYYSTDTAFAVGNPDWMNTKSEASAAGTFRQAQAEYRSFVYDNYRTLDQPMKTYLNEVLPERSGYIAVTKEIRRWLKDAKTATGEHSNAHSDAILRFMDDERRGNSSYYASAAVMMFRYYGIPARYAEGYLVDVPDGSTSQISKKLAESYQWIATGENVHAWVEVYKDGIGWVPVEVTPGFYKDMRSQQQRQQKLIQDTQKKQQKHKRNKDKDQKFDGEALAGKILCSLVILLMTGLLILILRRQTILRQRARALADANRQAALSALLPYGNKLLHYGGLSEADIPEAETEVLRRLRFRGDAVTEGEYRLLETFITGMAEAIYHGLKHRDKLVMKYVCVLY